MTGFLPLRAAFMALACLTAAYPTAGAAQQRTLTLDDVLSMQSFGSTLLSPDGRWVVHERRRPYDTATRFDRSHRSWWALSDLMISRTGVALAPEPLLPTDEGAGLLVGSWSPDSRKLLVYRLSGDRLEAGIVSLGDRSVRWTGLTPDLPVTGQANGWLDDHRLALTIRPAGDLPWMLRFDGTGMPEMDQRWRTTIEGKRPSRTRVETHAGRVETDAEPSALQLAVLDVDTGAVRVLAQGVIRDMAPSPGGERIAVLISEEPAPPHPSDSVIQSAVQTRSRVTIIDVASGEAGSPSETLDVAPHLLRWSPAGDALLLWARTDEQAWGEARLTSVGAEGAVHRFDTGDLQPLAAGRHVDELQVVQADWLADGVVLRARRPGEDRFDWWFAGTGAPRPLTRAFNVAPGRLASVSATGLLVFADGRLWRLDGTEEPTPITDGGVSLTEGRTHTLLEVARLRLNETPRTPWVVARSGDGMQIIGQDGMVRVHAASTACEGITQGTAAVATALVTRCLDDGVDTLTLATNGSERRLDRINDNFLGIAMPHPRPIEHLDHLGRRTMSWLYLPPGDLAEQVKGLLVLVYPDVVDDGRYIEATSLQMGPRAQLLASAGYAVLSAALPSEDDSVRSDMIDDFARGTDLAVDAALEAEPGLPKDRMAMIGHSFGGYTALAVATRSDRYRTYISWAGPTDMAGIWGEAPPQMWVWPGDWFTFDQSIGATEVGQTNMGGPPWGDVAGYAAASPYMLADQIEAPVLLITADRDYVPRSQAERMLTALHRRGGWARLVTYWGETHTNGSPANIRDVYGEIFEWLDRTMSTERVNEAAAAFPTPAPSLRWRPLS